MSDDNDIRLGRHCILKGLVQPLLQPLVTEGTARHSEAILEGRAVVAVLLRLILWWCADLHPAPIRSNSSKRHTETQGRLRRQQLPFPALNGGACRATWSKGCGRSRRCSGASSERPSTNLQTPPFNRTGLFVAIAWLSQNSLRRRQSFPPN